MSNTTIPDWPVSYRVRRAVELADLDVDKVADALGVTRSTVYNYISGASRPRRAALAVIANLSNVPLWWLEDRDPDSEEVRAMERAIEREIMPALVA